MPRRRSVAFGNDQVTNTNKVDKKMKQNGNAENNDPNATSSILKNPEDGQVKRRDLAQEAQDKSDQLNNALEKSHARRVEEISNTMEKWLVTAPQTRSKLGTKFYPSGSNLLESQAEDYKKFHPNVPNLDAILEHDSENGNSEEDAPWFTRPFGSPSSIESHESFMEREMDEVDQDAGCLGMEKFEDDTHAGLREEILGKWTRRFVQKRTKPKVINSLHRERLNLFARIWNDNNIHLLDREMIWVNLAARIRLHWNAIQMWQEVLVFYANEVDPIGNRNMASEIKDFFLSCTQMLSFLYLQASHSLKICTFSK